MRIPVTSHPPGIIPDEDATFREDYPALLSPPNDSAPCRPSMPLNRKEWTACSGIGGRHAPDSVDGLLRIQWSPSTGLRNSNHSDAN